MFAKSTNKGVRTIFNWSLSLRGDRRKSLIWHSEQGNSTCCFEEERYFFLNSVFEGRAHVSVVVLITLNLFTVLSRTPVGNLLFGHCVFFFFFIRIVFEK